MMWPEGCPYRQSLQRWLTPHGLEVNSTSIASYGISGFSFADLAPVQNYFICNKHTGSHPAKDSFTALLGAEYHLA
ncbi:hypothetical protein [Pseudomonas plecoglossicida]|uniref:hypothetical protein n=1 Tax=Pseudomonas plecoglossicida TaxID=70775 RepID=UPI0015E3BB64|nr:hypothetical protein [Pseudomonas plecoglossicida]MBA1324028.1 hypothetical protein [Pseudomonas plecoglossicida]